MEKTVYLVPAPDMDERSINAVQLEGCTVVPLRLEPIDATTELEAYIERLASQIRHSQPVLVGACYGGPLALELSRKIEVEKVVLVACIKSRDELTNRWKILYRAYLLLPPPIEKALGVSLAFVLNKIFRIQIKIPRIWLKGAQNRFIAQHLLQLQMNPRLKRLIRIHGQRDGIFPIQTIRDVDIVLDAGHFMLDTSRRATLAAIASAIHAP